MNESDIQQKLDILADLKASHDVLALQKKSLIDTVLTDEIRAKVADIDAEFAPKMIAAAEKIDAAEAEVRQAVMEHGASVKGKFIQAVWMKGRETWDGKLLAGFAIAHPEIAVARKVGEPSVSLRGVK